MTTINTGNLVADDPGSLRNVYQIDHLSKVNLNPSIQKLNIDGKDYFIHPKLQDPREINVATDVNDFVILKMTNIDNKIISGNDTFSPQEIKIKSITCPINKTYLIEDRTFGSVDGDVEGNNSLTIDQILSLGYLPSHLYSLKDRINGGEDVTLEVSGNNGSDTLTVTSGTIEALKVGMLVDPLLPDGNGGDHLGKIPRNTIITKIEDNTIIMNNTLMADIEEENVLFDFKPICPIDDKFNLTTGAGFTFWTLDKTGSSVYYLMNITYSFPLRYSIKAKRKKRVYNIKDDSDNVKSEILVQLNRVSTVDCTRQYKVIQSTIKRSWNVEWKGAKLVKDLNNNLMIDISGVTTLGDERELIEPGVQISISTDLLGGTGPQWRTLYIHSYNGSSQYYLSTKYTTTYEDIHKIKNIKLKSGLVKFKLNYVPNDMVYVLLYSQNSNNLNIELVSSQDSGCVNNDSFSQKITDKLTSEIQRDIDNLIGLFDKGLGSPVPKVKNTFDALDKNKVERTTLNVSQQLQFNQENLKISSKCPDEIEYTTYEIDLNDIVINPDENNNETLNSILSYVSEIRIAGKDLFFTCESIQELYDPNPINQWTKIS